MWKMEYVLTLNDMLSVHLLDPSFNDVKKGPYSSDIGSIFKGHLRASFPTAATDGGKRASK